jgi:hypothetical protein
LEGLAIEDVRIFYGHLVYFTAIWSVLWPFGILYGYLVYFSPFWYVVPRKNLATLHTTPSNTVRIDPIIGRTVSHDTARQGFIVREN